MIQSMLTKESPEIIRFFRNIESLSEILDTQAEKMRPVLNGERYMVPKHQALPAVLQAPLLPAKTCPIPPPGPTPPA